MTTRMTCLPKLFVATRNRASSMLLSGKIRLTDTPLSRSRATLPRPAIGTPAHTRGSVCPGR
ncbi:hypothetical protein BX265_6952 [Streptomyces sp. TLI_235]|nr:hypothetical protein BX265_6952 [Streptomyces sp. TLI_235]